MTVLRVLSPGLHTTVQDLGRSQAQHLGIPVSGALDSVSFRLANLLAGNDETAGALEMIAQGASFEVSGGSVRLALAGPDARLEPIEGGEPIGAKAYQSFTLESGARFRIRLGGASSVCYLAAEGGYAVPHIMGSQSTFVRGGMGGFQGRPLQSDDEIPLSQERASSRPELGLPAPAFPKQSEFRIILGPQDDYFSEDEIAAFLAANFTISHESDRMGFRLSGLRLTHAKGYNIISDGIAHGAIQVPGSGEPIILLADRQTTGGYPKIGVVISADLPALGRLRPGERLSFRAVDFEEARRAARELESWLSQAKSAVSKVAAELAVDMRALFEQNLIDGVVNAKRPMAE